MCQVSWDSRTDRIELFRHSVTSTVASNAAAAMIPLQQVCSSCFKLVLERLLAGPRLARDLQLETEQENRHWTRTLYRRLNLIYYPPAACTRLLTYQAALLIAREFPGRAACPARRAASAGEDAAICLGI
jgi:hypothetical protein